MSALRPDSNKGHDLGSSSVKWGTIHVGDVQAETITTSGNVEVQGNLTVTGTQTSLQVSTVEAQDPMIKLARGNSGDTLDIGFYGQSNDGSDKYHGLFRDQDDSGKFKLFVDLANEPGTTVATLSGANKATLVADVEGDITGSLAGNASTASALETARTLSVSGDAAGSVSFDGSADADIAVTIQADAVENSMILNPGFNYSDGGTPGLVELGQTITIQGTSNELEVSRSGGTFTLGLPSTISGLTSVSSTGFTGALTGNASTASSLETARTLSISGDATGSASFDGSANADIAITIGSGAVENSMLDNSSWTLTVDGTGGEAIALGDSLDFNGTSNQVSIAYSAANNDLTFSLPATIDVDTSGNAATATAQETARTFSITGSEVTASGVSYDGTGNVALSAAITTGSIANSKLANDGITFGNGVSSSDVDLGGSLSIAGTSNQVDVSYISGAFQVGLPSTIDADTSGNAATATAQETARDFSIGAGPVRAAAVSYDATGNVSLTSSIADDQITNAMLANDKLVIQVDSVDYDRALGSTLKFAKGGDLSLSYSASENEITYSLDATISSDTSGNAATATALETARNFSIGSGPVTASAVSFDGTGAVSLTSSIANGALSNAMLANSTTSFTDGSTSSDIALGGSLTIQGTSNEVEVSNSAGVFTVGLPSTIAVDVNGNATTATSWANARTVTLTGDVTGSFSIDGSASPSFATTIASGAVDNAMLANSEITFADVSGNSEALALGSTVYFGGTSSEVDVTYAPSINKFTFGLPDSVNITTNLDVGSGLSVGGNATITGNISAAGLTATGANVTFSDNLLELGVNNTDLEDIGFYGQRGDGIGGSNGFAGIAFDESADQFIAFTSTGEPTTTVGSYTPADFECGTASVAAVEAANHVQGPLRSTGSAPTSSSDTGTTGDIRFDSSYIYICTATDTWKRVALSTF